MKEVLDEEENPIHSTMLGCLSCLNSLIQHFDSVDLFLSRAEYAKGQDLAKRFYSLYSDLHDWAEDVGRKMFNITHKFHTSIHLFENTKYMNFRIHHNFRSEHFVGQISQLGHSCSFGVKSTRLSVKLMDKYRILATHKAWVCLCAGGRCRLLTKGSGLLGLGFPNWKL